MAPVLSSWPALVSVSDPEVALICPTFLTPTPASLPTSTILPAYIPPN
ncbi:MAG: hypothetical protein WAQ08_17050 [Aquabacterium sp.]